MVLLSFGKGRGETATYSPHGFVLDITDAVDLIYKLRSTMMAAGHPDPFPPQIGAHGDERVFNAGGGPGSERVVFNAGGGASHVTHPIPPSGWSVKGVGAWQGGPYEVIIQDLFGNESSGTGETQAAATADAISKIPS